MTLNEIRKRTGWKVIAGATAVGAIGIGGLALANGSDNANALPNGITLKDSTPLATTISESSAGFEVPAPYQVAGDSTFDSAYSSPLDTSTDASVASYNSPASVASVDSPDVNSVDSAASVASAASVDSVGSAASVDSPDDSP